MLACAKVATKCFGWLPGHFCMVALVFSVFTRVVTFRLKSIASTFMHLADAFIQSDSHCIQALCFFNACIPGNRTHNIGIASAKLQEDTNGAGQIMH